MVHDFKCLTAPCTITRGHLVSDTSEKVLQVNRPQQVLCVYKELHCRHGYISVNVTVVNYTA